jgi:hypothetical protein
LARRRRRIGQRRQPRVRCTAERVGRKHHDEIDRQRLPLDLAEIGDPGRDVAAEDVDGDRVADLQAEFLGFICRRNETSGSPL